MNGLTVNGSECSTKLILMKLTCLILCTPQINPPLRPQTPFCHLCSVDFRHDDDFNAHALTVHDLLPYVAVACDYCDKTFRNRKLADKHIKKVHHHRVSWFAGLLRCCCVLYNSKQYNSNTIPSLYSLKH